MHAYICTYKESIFIAIFYLGIISDTFVSVAIIMTPTAAASTATTATTTTTTTTTTTSSTTPTQVMLVYYMCIYICTY